MIAEKKDLNNYEGLFIVRPDLKEDEVKQAFKTIADSISKHDGTVKNEENWGKRQLAFPIKKFKEAFYYKVDFQALPDAISKLHGGYKLDQSILRVMITKR